MTSGNLQPGRMDATLVAYYGSKPEPFENLLTSVQEELRTVLPTTEFYSLSQVHATIIGFEGTRVGGHVINTNYLQRRQQMKPMKFRHALEFLASTSLVPFDVRVSGYRDGQPYPFTSRGAHPYLRSFSIQGESAVAMGWPFDGFGYPSTLDRLRREFNQFNVLHKFHAVPDDIDNDLFFVLGRVKRSQVSELELQTAQNRLRDFCATQSPVTLTVDTQCLSIVAYIDTTLPWNSTRRYTLQEAEKNVDEIVSAYREVTA